MDASEFLASVICYYSIIDTKYRLEGTQAKEGLENSLIEVYAAILKYVAEVEKTKNESLGGTVTFDLNHEET